MTTAKSKTDISVFDLLDTESASEHGAWFSLHAPGNPDKPLMYEGETLDIKTKGPNCDEWVIYERKHGIAARMFGAKNDNDLESEKAAAAKVCAAMTIGLRNFPKEVADIEKPASVYNFYLKHKDAREQLIGMIRRNEGFTVKAESE